MTGTLLYPFYKRALEIDPEYHFSYLRIGNNYLSSGQLDHAIPYLRKVVDLTAGPTRVGADIHALLFAYIDVGDFKSAAEIIARMNEFEPDDPTVIQCVHPASACPRRILSRGGTVYTVCYRPGSMMTWAWACWHSMR